MDPLGPRQPPAPVKFALGIAVMGVGFLLFLPIAGDAPGSAPLLGVTGILFVFTVASTSPLPHSAESSNGLRTAALAPVPETVTTHRSTDTRKASP